MLWFENNAKCREDRVAVKLRNDDGELLKSIIIPTAYYPLNSQYEVFSCLNTECCESNIIKEIFDRTEYKIGHCYQNAKALAKALRESGIDAKTYAGWLFVDRSLPIHHCWVVVGKSVLDLSDDFELMQAWIDEKYDEDTKQNKEKCQMAMIEYTKWAKQLSNTDRCQLLGVPAKTLYYIGSECDPDEARKMYQNLMQEYPHHECEQNCAKDGSNAMQRKLIEHGLM